MPGFTPVVPAFGQAPDGGFAPAAGAEDEGAFAGGFDEDGALGFEALGDVPAVPGVAPVVEVPAAGEVGGAPEGEDAVDDVETAPLVRDGAPAAPEAAEPSLHPLPTASVKSTITTAVPADGVRDSGRTYHRPPRLFTRTLAYPAHDACAAGRRRAAATS
ncbi:MAG: hypothetical protein HOV83_11320 [Catenulispora sp.]|nr:hypothetical protein [Catenulispora sp.]